VALVCYRVLQAANDLRASQVLAEAYQQLLTLAATIDDDALRKSFLGNVVVNREIVAEYTAHCPHHSTAMS
jgi:hypothetical protein